MERKPLSELLAFLLYMQYVIVETLTMIKHFVSMGYRIHRLLSASFFGEFKKKQYLCTQK